MHRDFTATPDKPAYFVEAGRVMQTLQGHDPDTGKPDGGVCYLDKGPADKFGVTAADDELAIAQKISAMVKQTHRQVSELTRAIDRV